MRSAGYFVFSLLTIFSPTTTREVMRATRPNNWPQSLSAIQVKTTQVIIVDTKQNRVYFKDDAI